MRFGQIGFFIPTYKKLIGVKVYMVVHKPMIFIREEPRENVEKYINSTVDL